MSEDKEGEFEYDGEIYVMFVCEECEEPFAVSKEFATEAGEHEDIVRCPNGCRTYLEYPSELYIAMTEDEFNEAFGDS